MKQVKVSMSARQAIALHRAADGKELATPDDVLALQQALKRLRRAIEGHRVNPD